MYENAGIRQPEPAEPLHAGYVEDQQWRPLAKNWNKTDYWSPTKLSIDPRKV